MTTPPLHVVASHVVIDPGGAEDLERAFAGRLGEVEQARGFVRLEVWRDEREPGRYVMTTWWQHEEDFRASCAATRTSVPHARIPTEPFRPHGDGVNRYTLVAR